MHLDDRHRDGRDGIAQRHRGVGIPSGIEHHAVDRAVGLLDGVDQLALDVGLEKGEFHIGEGRAKLREILPEGPRPVNSRVAPSLQVEVRAVDNQYLHIRKPRSSAPGGVHVPDKDTHISRIFRYLCVKTHPMTEFGFIEHIRTSFASLPDNGFEGIGDDCAVLPVGTDAEGREEVLLFTADLLTEGVHFLRRATPARELGRKALAVNLSDIAAMGGRPVATLLSIALPRDAAGTWAEEFMAGYRELSERYATALVGGDTTRSESGITINVTAVGRAPAAHVKRRSAARPGDVVFAAGELGASGAGLRDILAGRLDTPLAAAHRNPEPQVAEGLWLGAREEVHAMMDLSDGLASDLGHILERSAAGAEIDLERIPVAAGSDLRTAACGGEDYKLLFTAAADAAEELAAAFRARFGRPVYPIGRITAGRELVWMRDGRPEPLDWHGFTHY